MPPSRPARRPLSPISPHVLAVTADAELAEQLAGLAAAAGVPLDHRADLAAGWPVGDGVRLVLAGPDAALPPEHRPGVVLVSRADPGPQVWQRALEVGAEQVAVLPEAEPWLLERIVDAVSPEPTAAVIGVVGGSGGAGASTLAAAVATVAARSGLRTVLIDADPLGGGLDLLLGAEREAGLRWPDLLSARGRLQPGLLAATLPEVDGLWVLSWDRTPSWDRDLLPEGAPATDPQDPGVAAPASASAARGRWRPPPQSAPFDDPAPALPPAAVEAVLRAACSEFGLVVVDLSRRLTPGDLAAARSCRLVLVVVPAEVRATAAAGRVTAALDTVVADQRIVVRGPAPGGLPADAVADALDLPLAGELRREPAVAAALDRGEPFVRSRGTLANLARRVVAEVTG